MALRESGIADGTPGHDEDHYTLHEFYNQFLAAGLDISKLGMSKELDYAETTTAIAASNTVAGGTNMVDVPGLTVSYNFDGVTPVMLEVFLHASTNHLNVVPILQVRDAFTNESIMFVWFGSGAKADHLSTNRPIEMKRRFTPPAGLKTYKVSLQYFGSSGGEVRVNADPLHPSYIRLVSVDEA